MLRKKLADKSDQLVTVKMKNDELRVLKYNNSNSITSQLQNELQKMTIENKHNCKVLEEQNDEVCIY